MSIDHHVGPVAVDRRPAHAAVVGLATTSMCRAGSIIR
jgi:hypothetical protein